jgi:hypothetical protein
MRDHRCLTCRFWFPAYPEDDLLAAERALLARRGPCMGLAGACTRPGARTFHRSSRHTCDSWLPSVPSHLAAAAPGPASSATL